MSIFMIRFSCALLLIVPTMAEESDGPIEVVEAFHAALKGAERDEVLTFLAAEAVIFESGGAEQSRDEYASHHLGPDMRFSSVTQRRIVDQNHFVAGDVAWVLTRSETSGRFQDRKIRLLGVETMILRQVKDAWRIVHVHWSSRDQPGEGH